MDSKRIYNTRSKKKYHYTYLITNLKTGMKYIGVHSCNNLLTECIGVKYLSSSTDEDFIKEQKEHPERFKYEILQMFNTREEAENDEKFRHAEIDVAKSLEYYNLCNAPKNFSSYGKVVVKDKNGKTSRVSADDPRYLSGELVPVSKGMVIVKDKDGNIMQVSADDPKYLNGELIFHRTGEKYSKEHREKISKALKGVTRSEEHREKISKTLKGVSFSKERREKMCGRTSTNSPRFGKKTCHQNILRGENHPNFGKKRPAKKTVSIEGIIYPSIRAAVRELNLSQACVTNRLGSDLECFVNWFYVEKETLIHEL